MADISNRTLATLLLVAIVASITCFILMIDEMAQRSITGHATLDTSSTNFSISSTVSVAFVINNVNFGVGLVNESGSHNCTLNTSNAFIVTDCSGFNQNLAPLVIQNQGTINITLNVTFSNNASVFVNGTSPSFTYKMSNNESNPCGSNLQAQTWTEVVTQPYNNISICPFYNLNWVVGNRTLNMDIGVKIPQNAPTGLRATTITAYACNPC